MTSAAVQKVIQADREGFFESSAQRDQALHLAMHTEDIIAPIPPHSKEVKVSQLHPNPDEYMFELEGLVQKLRLANVLLEERVSTLEQHYEQEETTKMISSFKFKAKSTH
jgi:hypothetical protein